MDYYPSQDYHQGRRAAATGIEEPDVNAELNGMELCIRSLEDARKRLDQVTFTAEQSERYFKLISRLFDLTK